MGGHAIKGKRGFQVKHAFVRYIQRKGYSVDMIAQILDIGSGAVYKRLNGGDFTVRQALLIAGFIGEPFSFTCGLLLNFNKNSRGKMKRKSKEQGQEPFSAENIERASLPSLIPNQTQTTPTEKPKP